MKKRVTIEFRGTAEPLGRKNISQDFAVLEECRFLEKQQLFECYGTDEHGRKAEIWAPINALIYVHVTELEASTGQTEPAKP